MKLNDQLKYISRRIFLKNNIIFMLSMVLIITIMLFSLTLMKFVFDYKKINISNNVLTRTLIVRKTKKEHDFTEINKLDHVVFNDSEIYSHPSFSNVKKFDKPNKKSSVAFKPLIVEAYNETSLFKENLKQGEAICPTRFYPFSLLTEKNGTMQEYIDYDDILEPKDILNKVIKISRETNKNEHVSLKITNTYDASKTLNSLDTCYIKKSDFLKIKSPYKAWGSFVDVDGNHYEEYYEYENNVVIVDNYKNIDKVIKNLSKLGFAVEKKFIIEEDYLNLMFQIPLYLCLIILIICLNLIYKFISKKIKNNTKQYGLLMTVGYNKKQIYYLSQLESIIIMLLIIFLSLIIYFISLFFLKKYVLYEFYYNNININVPYFWFLFSSFILIIIVILFLKRIFKNNLKSNIANLLKED